MTTPTDLQSLSRDDLIALVVRQQRQIAELTTAVEALRGEVQRLTRDGKRQAAPFSKGTRVAQPKGPGRKPGQGPFRYRTPPAPATITEPDVAVPVTASACPACGGTLAPERVDAVYQTELPAVVRPRITRYRVAVCRCTACGRRLRGEPPDVAPGQWGATAHRVGPRLMAAAHLLHYGLGVPIRKVPALLRALTGVILTQGALTQDALRRAGGAVGGAYPRLRTDVRGAPVVHTDDTGWRVGGVPAWLMTFETDTQTVYQVRPRHRNEEVREVVPADYAGVMVSDRGKSYDATGLGRVRQQKCLAHIQRSLTAVVQTKRGKAWWFGTRLQGLLRDAVALWHGRRDGKARGFATRASRLRTAITHPLRDRTLSDRDNQRLLNERGRHHDRGDLLRFLDDPALEPTNNRAERALRPAVIGRKVSQCSKTGDGAEAFAAWTSVVRTLAKTQGDSVIETLLQVSVVPKSVRGPSTPQVHIVRLFRCR
jgi:transposase